MSDPLSFFDAKGAKFAKDARMDGLMRAIVERDSHVRPAWHSTYRIKTKNALITSVETTNMKKFPSEMIIAFMTFSVGIMAVSVANEARKRVIPKSVVVEVRLGDPTIDIQNANRTATGFVGYTPPLTCNDPNIKPIWRFILTEIGDRNVYVYDCRELVEIIYFNLDDKGPSESLVLGTEQPFWLNRGNTKFWVFKKSGRRFKNILSGYTQNDSEIGSQVLSNRTRGHNDILLRFQFACCSNYYAHVKFNGRRYAIHREWVSTAFDGPGEETITRRKSYGKSDPHLRGIRPK